jgi:hypothetical protein
MSLNLHGKNYAKIQKEKAEKEKILKETAYTEMYEFPPSYNAAQHPRITITAGPQSTAKGLKRRYKNKHHKKTKKHNKKSKKHHKRSQNKKSNKRRQ